jgi:hypothetical protein
MITDSDFCESKKSHRKLYAAVLAIMTMLTLGAIVIIQWRDYQRLKRLVRDVESVGGEVFVENITPGWLPPMVFLDRPRVLQLLYTSQPIDDSWLQQLRGFNTVQSLGVGGRGITDEGLRDVDLPLIALNVASTRVTGRNLGQFRDLESLNARNSEFDDEGLAALKDLPKLTALLLDNTKITDVGLAHLGQIDRLEHLSLTGTTISDKGLRHLRNLKGLKYLDLTATHLTDEGLEVLLSLPQLEHLFVADTEITDAGAEVLGSLSQLVLLDLSGTDISDEGLKALGQLRKMTNLFLRDTSVTGPGLRYIAGLPQVMEIDLTRSAISDAGIAELQHLLREQPIESTKRIVLHLDETNIGPDGVRGLNTCFPKCEIWGVQ